MTQEDLINCPHPRIRCLAGPGTGKTWSIKNRVERLLVEEGVDGSKIFAVTFTRLAASQLKSELTDMEIENAESITASTLHSHALKILGHEQAIEALGRYPRICFEHEIQPLRHDLSIEFSGHVKPVKQLMKAFDTMWAKNDDESVRASSNANEKKFDIAFHNWMEFHQAMTVGELIPLAITFLNQNPVNDAVDAFEYIIVDEYQDLNKADQTLINILGENSNMLIVGDDDQSIYSFRHAEPEGIRRWLEHQPDPKEDIHLNICRRCDGNIISLANSLINHNSGRTNSDLEPMSEKENIGDVELIQWNTRNNETKGIAKGIQKILENGQVPDGEKILVLVPRREFGEYLLKSLTDIGVTDVKCHTKVDWKDQDIGENLALLILHDTPTDRVALRYWLGLNHSKWRNAEYKKLVGYCKETGAFPTDVLDNLDLCKQLKLKGLREQWTLLQTKLTELKKLNDNQILDQLLPVDGPMKEVSEQVRALKHSLNEDDEINLSELLTQTIVSHDNSNDEAKVNIMTLYGAKGLTSHTVILAGLINGLLPKISNPRTMEDTRKLEEDRRLVYVALTRAKKQLIISSFRQVQYTENQRLNLGLNPSGNYCNTSSSRFISELGPGAPNTLKGEDWLSLLGV
ncbi:Superfamily I DNA or RNA helicase [Methanococcoides vulcani]|uniref:DNA 3'-5' helicase n=1 Tax=Methanococcoides vulcani TaxID=1353158 RepID=A0A1H9YBK2_9EURY|nr:ATP-dependent helicase [Methanococcoides vulcani]SES66332.1 Superfamily I DNA or RNA helicase [Methanococcoides vulcani]